MSREGVPRSRTATVPRLAPVVAAAWPAAAEAGALLAGLGIEVTVDAAARLALAAGGAEVEGRPSTVQQDWADAGAMAVTGWPHRAPVDPVGRPATVARAAGLAFELLSGTRVDGAALLGERAAIMGLRRHGQLSAGGGTRMLRARDTWWALNLARDLDLVPALIESAVDGDPWQQVGEWSAHRPVAAVIERTRLLGLAAAALGETPASSSPWRIEPCAAAGPAPRAPVVVNFGALWAGPLAAQLLALGGAQVVDVETPERPDPTRVTSPEFYRRLHAGHERRQVDFADSAQLRDLIATADVVIEASRPRVFEALGIDPRTILASGRPRIWLRITGHRDPDRIAFGDDAAVGGGLVAWDAGEPVFAGDAIADPLTGVLAALAVTTCLRAEASCLIELSLADVAAYCAAQYAA